MAGSKLSIVLLLALVPVSLAIVGEKEKLYETLFAKDAPVMEAGTVPFYLNRIKRYLPQVGQSYDEVNAVEVQDLINAGVLSNDRCESYDKFKEVFHNLANRQYYKLDEAGVWVGHTSNNGVSAWNANIQNYISNCASRQLVACAGLLNGFMEKITEEEKKILDETTVFNEESGKKVYKDYILQKMSEAFGAKLKAKSVKQKHIEKEVGKLLAKVEGACKSVEKHGDSFSDLLEEARMSAKYKPLLDAQTLYWVDRMSFCGYILHPVAFTYHGSLQARHQHGEYVLPQLVSMISEKY